MRYRETRDANETEIVRTLEAIPGVVVRKLGNENGMADLLVRRASWESGRWLMVEIKTQDGRIKSHQAEMFYRGETILARSAGDILERIGINTGGAS